MKNIVMLLFAMTSIASGQSAPVSPPYTFDVASVKVNKSGAKESSLSRSKGRVTLTNVSLRECLELAYGIASGRDYAIVGPNWIDSDKFDIIATLPPATPRPEVFLMVQHLLAERFHLRLHRELREVRAYILAVDKAETNLHPAQPRADGGSFSYRTGHLSCSAVSMAEFADRLNGSLFRLGAPVVDETGLSGVYDFTIDWTPESSQSEAGAGPSIFTALKEQLGLKLRAGRRQIEILVIDQADRHPTEN